MIIKPVIFYNKVKMQLTLLYQIFSFQNIFHVLIILSLCVDGNVNARKPNIVFILADDLGYNHIGYHNPNIISPNIDRLANTGIRLEHNYVQPVCTPSRAALLTGMYPYHLGRQNEIISPTGNCISLIFYFQTICFELSETFYRRNIFFIDPTGLTLNVTLLPQILKRKGYRTHLIGKWHLGHCNKKYLPLSRGFETHYGFWEGAEDYYTKVVLIV